MNLLPSILQSSTLRTQTLCRESKCVGYHSSQKNSTLPTVQRFCCICLPTYGFGGHLLKKLYNSRNCKIFLFTPCYPQESGCADIFSPMVDLFSRQKYPLIGISIGSKQVFCKKSKEEETIKDQDLILKGTDLTVKTEPLSGLNQVLKTQIL